MIYGIELWAAVGFIFAAYAVVGNDALQTLGTFINSNRNLHWTILFAFAAVVLVVTFTYGWHVNGGDPSYGRLANEAKYPPISIQWYHTLPPLVLVIITRLGIPVSTSFMVLTIFASVAGLGSMLEKSLIGYALAFAVGGLVYLVISRNLEEWFKSKSIDAGLAPFGLISAVGVGFLALQYYVFGFIDDPAVFFIGSAIVVAIEALAIFMAISLSRKFYWVATQWTTTAYLWGIWLVQDFANIFVFLPRELTAIQGFLGMAAILVLLGITFANNGGPVQRILKSKSNVTDIRSATIIDFLYATLLFYFKEVSDIPMSTTWVFLGLIAGREYAFAFMSKSLSMARAVVDTAEDVAKAFIGIVISIDLAVGLPLLAQRASGTIISLDQVFPSDGFAMLVIVANAAMLPIAFFAFSRAERHGDGKLKWAIGTVGLLVAMTAAFFYFPLT